MLTKKINSLIKSNYIYNLSWEDPRVDHEVLRINHTDVICAITSGGDNILDYLLLNPEKIYAVDVNPNQNYLLEFKIACMKVLNHKEFFSLFAKSNYSILKEKYSEIKLELSENAKIFWDKNKTQMQCFLLSGQVKKFIYILHFYLKLTRSSKHIQWLKDNPGMINQKFIFKKYRKKIYLLSKFFYWIYKYLGSHVAVPPKQFNKLSRNHMYRTLYKIFHYTDIINDNYFYYAYLYLCFSNACCPRYMQSQYYELIRKNLHCVKVYTGKLDDVIKNDIPKSTISKMILLDHMDWMNEDEIAREWSIFKNCCRLDCQYLWRSVTYYNQTKILNNLNFKFQKIIGKKSGFSYDRVAMYNSIYLATIPSDQTFIYFNTPQYTRSIKKDLSILGKMALSSFFSSNQANFIQKYYRNQASYYDSYRSRMLHGKKSVIITLNYKRNMRILIQAGGTADILEYISDKVPTFDHITIVDINADLLSQAKKRVNRYGWNNVEIIEGCVKKFVREDYYDLIINTYALTMIDNWKKVIDNANTSLKQSGQFAVSDFTVKNLSQWNKLFWIYLLKKNHVYLNFDYIEYMDKVFKNVYLNIEFGGFPLTPNFIKCPYYYAIYRKR